MLPRSIGPGRLSVLLTGVALAACGARTPLNLETEDGNPAGGNADDLCPSAVLGPKPMFGNCSTRDGRSRIRSPKSPHTKWTLKLPTTTTGKLGAGDLASGPSSHAYVVSGDKNSNKGFLLHLKAVGGIDTAVPIVRDSATTTPTILKSGTVNVFALDDSDQESIRTYKSDLTSSAATTYGFDLYNAPGTPAVGSDGSLYLVHHEAVGTVNANTYLSRVRPDGSVAWTSAGLGGLCGLPSNTGMLSTYPVALDRKDLVLIVVSAVGSTGSRTLLLALEPISGEKRWLTTIPGSALGGAVVRADNSIVVLTGAAGGSNLVVIDPDSGVASTTSLSAELFQIAATTVSNGIVARTVRVKDTVSLVALDDKGKLLWTRPTDTTGATIDADGNIIAFGATVVKLDPGTGAELWEYSPPTPGSCLFDVALTSEGGIVGVQCDTSLFYAAD